MALAASTPGSRPSDTARCVLVRVCVSLSVCGVRVAQCNCGTLTRARAASWKENLLFIYDGTVNKHEGDPPEDAILVFLAPVEVDIATQVGCSARKHTHILNGGHRCTSPAA